MALLIPRLHGSALGLAFALGFGAASSAAPLADGPWRMRTAVDLSPSAEIQRHLSGQAPWQAFVKQHGPWRVQWDEATGTPRRAWGAGIATCAPTLRATPFSTDSALACAAGILQSHPELVGIPMEELGPGRVHTQGDKVWMSWPQVVGDVPVEGASVEMRFVRGMLVVLGVATHPGAGAAAHSARLSEGAARQAALAALKHDGLGPARGDSPQLRILPMTRGGPLAYRLAWRVPLQGRGPADAINAWVEATSGALLAQTPRVSTAVDGSIAVLREQRLPGDALTEAPLGFATVSAAGISTTTQELGSFFIPTDAPRDVSASLSGPYARVYDEALADIPNHRFNAVGDTKEALVWSPVDDAELAALDAYAATLEVRAYVQGRRPDLSFLDQPLNISVNGDGGYGDACNAYFGPDVGMVLLRGDDDQGCVNFARLADIVYHEYGHGVHHALMVAGNFDGAVSEGSADYLAATLLNSPIIGPGAYGPGTRVRELETDKILPWDLVDQVHTDGLIWAGALWDLREELTAAYGFEAGRARVDDLLFTVLVGGPTLWDLYPEVLAADDDDGDLANGTPNLCAINRALGPHGLGDGQLGLVSFGHSQLGDQAPDAAGYTITADPVILGVDSADQPCGIASPSTLVTWYKVEAGPWVPVGMTPTEAGLYAASIPPAPPGSTISYDIQIWDSAYERWASLTGGRDDLAPSFYVGEAQALFCDDMEAPSTPDWSHDVSPTGARDDWHRDIPLGLSQDPRGAASGLRVWGTNLGLTAEDGWPAGRYRPDQTTTLTSPPIDATGQRQIFMRYNRWLTAEDAAFDPARISASGQVAWQSYTGPKGLSHTLDRAWFSHRVPLWGMDNDAEATVSFSLVSDEGLEFGGWNIDDVCVYAPTDLPGRYRSPIDVSELGGEGDGGIVRVTGALPWANPMSRAALVRKTGEAPMTVGDGVTVEQWNSPIAGEAFEIDDDGATRGAFTVYRLFAWDGTRWWPEAQDAPGTETVTIVISEAPSPTPSAAPTPSMTATVAPSPTATATPHPPSPTETSQGPDHPTPTSPERQGGCSCHASSPGHTAMPTALVLALVMMARRPRRSRAERPRR